jgi:hypothetical protein
MDGEPVLKTMAELAAEAAEGRDALGFECRRCGCRDFRVVRTKQMDGRIMRRRKCRHCGHSITTYEKEL